MCIWTCCSIYHHILPIRSKLIRESKETGQCYQQKLTIDAEFKCYLCCIIMIGKLTNSTLKGFIINPTCSEINFDMMSPYQAPFMIWVFDKRILVFVKKRVHLRLIQPSSLAICRPFILGEWYKKSDIALSKPFPPLISSVKCLLYLPPTPLNFQQKRQFSEKPFASGFGTVGSMG